MFVIGFHGIVKGEILSECEVYDNYCYYYHFHYHCNSSLLWIHWEHQFCQITLWIWGWKMNQLALRRDFGRHVVFLKKSEKSPMEQWTGPVPKYCNCGFDQNRIPREGCDLVGDTNTGLGVRSLTGVRKGFSRLQSEKLLPLLLLTGINDKVLCLWKVVTKTLRLEGRIRPSNTGEYNRYSAQEQELLEASVMLCWRHTSSEERGFISQCDLGTLEKVRRGL